MNGGNDFSTGGETQDEIPGGVNEYTVNNSTSNIPDINNYIKSDTGGGSLLDEPPATATNTKFDKLVIKKVE